MEAGATVDAALGVGVAWQVQVTVAGTKGASPMTVASIAASFIPR